MEKINVAVLDDHPGIIDGYRYRLSGAADMALVAAAAKGEDLEPMLAHQRVDVLLLDVQVPTSADNPNPYPILYLIPKLLERYPDMQILIISMHTQRTLIHALMEAGSSGYVLKDDQAAIEGLPTVIRLVADGGIYLSEYARQQLMKRKTGELSLPLSPRQLQALSLCIAYPDSRTSDLALKMGIEHSSFRNLLSSAYLKLEVRSKSAAIAKARKLGLLPPDLPAPSGRDSEQRY